MTGTWPPTTRGFRKRGPEPYDTGIDTVPVGPPGPGEAIVEVIGCGICGSDLHAVRADPGYEMIRPPVVLGHEATGTVVGAGPGADAVLGHRVVPVSIQGCGTCPRCQSGRTQLCADRTILGIHRDGGLAGHLRIPVRHLVEVPGGVGELDAALTEPLSVAVHAVLERSVVRPGDRVVVTGPGTIGLLCAQLARASGAEVLVLGAGGDAAVRLPLAERFGAATADLSATGAAGAVRARFGAAPPDLWLEASGAVPAFDAAVDLVAAGGRITVIAQYAARVGIFIPDLLRREIDLNFSYAANPAAYARALRLLASGTVSVAPLITTYPLAEVATAVDDAAASRVVKAVVETR